MTHAHLHRPNQRGWSVVDQLAEFFRKNPGEELTFADIVMKFDTTASTAYNAVDALRKAGLVDVVKPPQVVRGRVPPRMTIEDGVVTIEEQQP